MEQENKYGCASWAKGVRNLHSTQKKIILEMRKKNVEGSALTTIDTILQFAAGELSVLAYLCSQDTGNPYEQSAKNLADRFMVFMMWGKDALDALKKEQTTPQESE